MNANKKSRPVIALVLGAIGALIFARIYIKGTSFDEPFTDGYVPPGSAVEARVSRINGREVVQVLGVVDSPVEKIWDTVKDHKNMIVNTPKVIKSDLIENDEQHEKMRLSFNIWIWERSTEILATKAAKDGGFVKEWKEVGGSIPVNRGRWMVRAVTPNSTRVLYELDLDAGLPLPHWMETTFLLDYLPKVVKRMGKNVHAT